MKSNATMMGFGIVCLLLASCGSDSTSSGQTSVEESTIASTTVPTDTAPTSTTQPAATTTTSTTSTTTLPAGPPVFDAGTLGDNLSLPSFVLTVTVDNTNNGQLNETITTSEFTSAPIGVAQLATFSFDGTTDGLRRYIVNGRSYEENISGDWYLFEAGSSEAPDHTNVLDLRAGTLGSVLSADLTGQEEFLGVPANHFVFDETDLASYASYTPEHPGPEVEGDFYLAQDGNYILYTHSIETSPGRMYEVTEALSSVGQVATVALPPELNPMTEALDVGVALGHLLPPGAALSTMIRYDRGIGIDYYTYDSPVPTNDELLTFLRALPPTEGWTVSHVGHIRPHLEPTNCETKIECVILVNGGDQIVVSFGRGITIEYDREHVFSPL